MAFAGLALLARPLGSLLTLLPDASPVLMHLIAGAAVLLILWIIVGGIVPTKIDTLLGRFGIVSSPEGDSDENVRCVPGLLMGAVSGLLVTSFIVWCIIFYRGMAGDELPGKRRWSDQISGHIAATFGMPAFGFAYPEGAWLEPTVAFVHSDPARGMRTLRALWRSPSFMATFADGEFQEALAHASVSDVSTHSVFLSWLEGTGAQSVLETMPEESATALRINLAEITVRIYRGWKRLDADPAGLARLQSVRSATVDRDLRLILSDADLARLVLDLLAMPPEPLVSNAAARPQPK